MDAAAPLISHVVWAPDVYMVPRRDGRLILGATVEEKGFDTTLTAGGVLALLEAAWRVLPAIEDLPIDEMWVGHRPGSRDDAPILGPAAVDGLIYATGHHRNGILLTPVTAEAIARLVRDGAMEPRDPAVRSRAVCARAGGGVTDSHMTQAHKSTIRINGESEPLAARRSRRLLEEKAVDTEAARHRGRA